MGADLSKTLFLAQLTEGQETMLLPITAATVFAFGADYPIAAPFLGFFASIGAMIAMIPGDNTNVPEQLTCGLAGALAAVAGEFVGARMFAGYGGGFLARLLVALSAGFAGFEGYEQTARTGDTKHAAQKAWGYLYLWQWWAVVLGSLVVIYGAM